MEGKPDNKDRITKTKQLPRRIIKKLGQSKNINGYGKKNHEEAV